ncbi:MAG: hypothetical protein FWE27_01545 [Defluviitaleaceae bacterium]|nr:hypothetical protein [Defluviitaleaceae bacterium]
MKNGNAYIMVVVASLAVLTLVLAVLTITATSRNITASYENFFGLYDIAVTGNEQIFYFMEEKFFEQRTAALALSEANGTTFVNEITKLLRNELDNAFELIYFEYHRHEWGLIVEFSDLPASDYTLSDDFRAVTTVRDRQGGGFYIETSIRKYINNVAGHETVVRSRINFLDDYAVEMVELLRI